MSADNLPTAAQVANVLAGMTADGKPHGKPIAFPPSGRRRDILVRWADPFPAATDRVRTAYIIKLAHYLVRLSPSLSIVDVWGGMMWFVDHPEQVCMPLSFAGAVRRARENFARECNAARKEEREALWRAMNEPMPAPPVLYEDGNRALQEVIHPKQMMVIGLAAMNCLARGHGGKHRYNVRYWSLVSQKHLRIFALWEGERLLCVFSVADGVIREWQYVAPPAEVVPLLPACFATLVRDAGPLSADHAIIVFAGRAIDVHEDGSSAVRRALGGLHARI